MRDGQIVYQAAAAANVVVTAKPAYLHRILIGKDVTNAVIEVSDHAADGNGNVKVYSAGSTLMTSNHGVIEVGANFPHGICADLTNQTNVTFVFSNQGLG